MTSAARRAIAVFAKVPRPGAVKTRLIPALGAAGAADLQRRLIESTLARARAVADTDVHLWLAGDPAGYSPPPGCSVAHQEGSDLGARMAHAFVVTLARSRACALIGTDCPALTPAHLRESFDQLERNDVVLIPAQDGGYVLIALNAPQPRLFEDIRWGTSSVLETTRERIASAQLRAAYLTPLPDLDTPADLEQAVAAGWIGR